MESYIIMIKLNMDKKSKVEKGFSVVEALLVIGTLVLIVAAGYVVYKGHHKTSSKPEASSTTNAVSNPQTTPTQDTNPYASWKTYMNQEAGLTFKYPPNWDSQVSEMQPYSDGSFAGAVGTLTSPSGNPLYWVYQVIGGKGDVGCTPAAGDTPFAPGNKCPSKQIISVEQIPSVKTTKTFRNLFGDSLYITETKISEAYNPITGKTLENSPSYQICLDPFTDGEGKSAPVVSTVMGFELPCEYWDTGFNAMFPVANATGFNTVDAKTAVLIMKSFGSL